MSHQTQRNGGVTAHLNLHQTTLKDAAFACNLVLNPKVIAVDFEQGAIATFRAHLSNAKIIGCHFHLTSYYHF